MSEPGSGPAALRDALDARALGGAGWPEVLSLLARAAGCEVRLVAADAALLCAAGPAGAASAPGTEAFDAPRPAVVLPADVARAFAAGAPIDVRARDGLAMRGVPVSAGGRRLGVLLVAAPTATGAADQFLRAAVTAVAIVALRRDVQAAAGAETAAWFVDELRFGSRRVAAELAAVAHRFGVELAEPQTPVAIGYGGPDRRTFATALSWLETPARVDGSRAWTILGGEPRGRVTLIHRRLRSFLGDDRVYVAAGPVASGVEAIRDAFDRAGFALRLLAAGRLGPVAEPGTVTYEELGLAGVLFAVPRVELAALVQANLGPVLDRDDLLATLRAWYGSGGSRSAVAEAVHIHRNSVGHRMDRLRALLGRDPADPATALQLRAALVAADLLAVLDPDRD